MKRIVFLLILLFTTVCVSCSTLRGNLKVRDPWSGRFLHHSGKFELVLDHFDKDATIAKIFEFPRVNGERPHAMFSADIQKDKAIFQSRDPSCRVELQVADQGIIVSDFCHGTGEDEGLYRIIR